MKMKPNDPIYPILNSEVLRDLKAKDYRCTVKINGLQKMKLMQIAKDAQPKLKDEVVVTLPKLVRCAVDKFINDYEHEINEDLLLKYARECLLEK